MKSPNDVGISDVVPEPLFWVVEECVGSVLFLVEAEDTVAVIADQLDAADDGGDGGFFLDLLVNEPAEQRKGVDVVG